MYIKNTFQTTMMQNDIMKAQSNLMKAESNLMMALLHLITMQKYMVNTFHTITILYMMTSFNQSRILGEFGQLGSWTNQS